MRILLAHTSLSGNTRDVARAIHARCEAQGHAVTWIDTDTQTLAEACPDGAAHDLYLLGSWSINAGRTPPDMKRFIADLVAAVGKPEQLAVFGTGETQWGEEHYCGAIRRIGAFFGSRYPPLEIEQMPHGARDALNIQSWTDQVLARTAATANRISPDTDTYADTDTSRSTDTTIETPPHADPARVVA